MGDVERASLSTLAAQINSHHRAAKAALAQAVTHAIEAGECLVAAKKQVRHGEWLGWVAENFDGCQRTAQLYMRFARHRHDAQRLAHLGVAGVDQALTERKKRSALGIGWERPDLPGEEVRRIDAALAAARGRTEASLIYLNSTSAPAAEAGRAADASLQDAISDEFGEFLRRAMALSRRPSDRLRDAIRKYVEAIPAESRRRGPTHVAVHNAVVLFGWAEALLEASDRRSASAARSSLASSAPSAAT